jgi:acyl-CoA synthetase (AMP-forming)/AMP-acid ligase II
VAWLRQITVTSATISGAPNFAYDLCIRKVTSLEMADLDLSSWSTAFSGSEPVRRRTLARFAAKFGPAGFQPGALAPSYGLAEATLLVSAGYWRPDRQTGERVSCGRPPFDEDTVTVVDPVSAKPAAEGQEGEIWLRGPSVTPGYWSEGTAVEHARGECGGQPYLRTGDLGLLQDGELVVTGRQKDVIIRNGVNYHPEDIEMAALEGNHPFRSVCVAFDIDTGAQSLTCLVLESSQAAVRAAAAVPSTAQESVAAEVTTVRARVVERTGLWPDTVLVTPTGSIPRTSSGKICRSEARELFRSGAWDQYVVAGLKAKLAAYAAAETCAGVEESADDVELRERLITFVSDVFAAVCEVPVCQPHMTIFEIGGDSLRAAEAAAVLERALGTDISVALLLDLATPEAVVLRLMAERAHAEARAALADRLTWLEEQRG